MRHHVAILQTRFLKRILNGTKTIESRITRHRLAPWNCIDTGDVIHLKQSSGPFRATAIAGKIHSYSDLTPHRIRELQIQFSDLIFGHSPQGPLSPDEYWLKKLNCKYATFIELTHIKPTNTGPSFPKSHGLAWFVLDQPLNQPSVPTPVTATLKRAATAVATSDLQIRLTAGALKNRYLCAPHALALGPVTLLLPHNTQVQTHITASRRFATRKWAAFFKPLQAGDIAHFVPQGDSRYRVIFKTSK